MKYTGLLDINGVKIYEGSTIRNLNHVGTELEQIGTVFHWHLPVLNIWVWSCKNSKWRSCIEKSANHPAWGCIVIDVMEESSSCEEKEVIENHFDIFNLIPEGLAIDVNTIMK